jgi:hypothetical protein
MATESICVIEEMLPGMGPVESFYSGSGLSPDMMVSEMTDLAVRPESDSGNGLIGSSHGAEVELLERPEVEDQYPVESRDNGNSANGSHHEHIGNTAMTGLALIKIEELQRRGDIEGLKRLGDPDMDHEDHVAEFRGTEIAHRLYRKKIRSGKIDHPPASQASIDRLDAADGSQFPPVINGRRISGEEWEILGHNKK